MAYILAILWGLVQGLTEILPVSGSAHMAILERVLGQTAARTEQRFFYGLLDLALAAAVLLAYRQTSPCCGSKCAPGRAGAPQACAAAGRRAAAAAA